MLAPCRSFNSHSSGLFAGPALEEGPLPALFYFALSARESLELSPYCQPVQFILTQTNNVRIFSWTLPGHDLDIAKERAVLEWWGAEMHRGNNLLGKFLDEVCCDIAFLRQQGFVTGQSAAIGLSRGGWIAAQLAGRLAHVSHLLLFSPLTDLTLIGTLQGEHSFSFIPPALDITAIVDQLAHVTVKTYVGNRDVRVSTDKVYRWIEQLTERAYACGHRTPPVELNLFPSIGQQGHGTPREIFQQGVQWLCNTWLHS